ncbi:TonB-dependent receptor [Methylobacillus arboreus]|uniref:TonB-dependent receptor n=1 Tax=Methylobacillus arboreus TaxID=755170 RepID=UPI001E2947C7|nr:TonB-dependent receptor [Methylobacillus arboreus]MCB5191346.1 TonB-dependent receptor [Methylobacillus arboreus]
MTKQQSHIIKTLVAGVFSATIGSPVSYAKETSRSADKQDDIHQLETLLVKTSSIKDQKGLNIDTPSEAGSRLGLTIRENPASVAVADRQKMEEIGARNFQDAANSLPGVNASAPPGHGGFVAYRGFTGAQVNQLFNGISLQYNSANRPVDAWVYDHVELVGGPSSFLYGSGSIGGSLNYVTKLATRDEEIREAHVSHARYDTMETAVGINHALNETNWVRLDFSRNTSNGYIDRQERQASSLAVSWLADLTPRLSHTLALEHHVEREDSPYWGTPTLQPQSGTLKIDKSNRFKNYNVRDGRYEQRVTWARSITDYKISDQTSLRNTFYHYRGQRDFRNLEVYGYNASNTLVTRSDAYMQRHNQELNGNRIELRHNGELFDLRSDWSFGADYSVNQQTVYPTSGLARSQGLFLDVVTPGNFEPDYFADIPGMNNGLQKGRSTEVKTLAAFIENRQYLSRRLSLVTGLRYDHIDFHLDNGSATPSTVNRRWDTLTGRAGMVFDITDEANIYAQYSTSAEPPGGTLTSASAGQVNNDFKLSTGYQFEVGSKFNYLDGRGTATIAAYHIVRRDFPVTDPQNRLNTILAGQQTSNGIELASSLQITPRLRAEGNIAWIDAEFDDFNETVGTAVASRKGKTPVNVPDQVANLRFNYDITPDWQAGIGARYVSSVYANNANTMWIPSYTLFDMHTKYRVGKNADLTARIRNLTDQTYARFIHQSNAQYYVGEPRSLEVALHIRF